MAETILTPAQLKPAAATLSTLLTVGAGTKLLISTITVVNLGSSMETFRVAVRPGGAAINDAHYKMYNVRCDPGNPYMATVGWLLAATDVVSVYSSGGNLVFQAERLEVT